MAWFFLTDVGHWHKKCDRRYLDFKMTDKYPGYYPNPAPVPPQHWGHSSPVCLHQWITDSVPATACGCGNQELELWATDVPSNPPPAIPRRGRDAYNSELGHHLACKLCDAKKAAIR